MLDAGSNIVDEYDKEYRSKDRTLWNPTDDCGYYNSRNDYKRYMIENPWVAKAKKINVK